ncbi:MAG: S-methyl-5-thioribose-1-phosphate isomerase [Kiritimatiellae bacterium]|nr:S-methyl-5-thioribose-1-phosphate isomerase [Kiritimatiellia bacterium]
MGLKTVEWIPASSKALIPGKLRMIEQTRLPQELQFLETDRLEVIWEAIHLLRVRGAPAIGVAAAMGVVAGIQQDDAETSAALVSAVNRTADYLATSRPTAVNLFWALDRMRRVASENQHLNVPALKERLAREATAIRDEDAAMCRAIGEHGVTLLKDGWTILTHCNAGGLATAEFGTALAPVYVAKERGMNIRVISDETRPLLQGSRLTAWELNQAGIDVTIICDNMAAKVMREGKVQAVLVGSDRIAANGDVCNKIGTYGVAILARAHHIPFYALAPSSTFDLSIPHGDDIPIEERHPDEVVMGFGRRTGPEGVRVYSPAFDVTPAEYVTAIVCEKGLVRPPYGPGLRAIMEKQAT